MKLWFTSFGNPKENYFWGIENVFIYGKFSDFWKSKLHHNYKSKSNIIIYANFYHGINETLIC